MKLKKFTAPSVREALILVKEELGSDAVIIRTEGKDGEYEVTAALDEASYARPTDKKSESIETYNRKGKSPEAKMSPPKVVATPNSDISGSLVDEVKLLRQEVVDMKSNMGSQHFEKLQNVPAEFRFLAAELLNGGMLMEYVADIIAEIAIHCSVDERQPANILRLAREYIAKKLPLVSGVELKEDRSTSVLFVGPTGAGKSTTIAKLAAQQVLSGVVEVGIISTDSYRMGAMEQMQIFSKTASIDFCAVFEDADLDAALEQMSGKDLILIDTAGRSRHHKEHFAELVHLYKKIQPDEVHLVLSANTRDRDLQAFYEQYSIIGISRLSYTKVDETLELASLYNLPMKQGLPISLVCHGQNIPDDIAMADPAQLSKWIVEGKL